MTYRHTHAGVAGGQHVRAAVAHKEGLGRHDTQSFQTPAEAFAIRLHEPDVVAGHDEIEMIGEAEALDGRLQGDAPDVADHGHQQPSVAKLGHRLQGPRTEPPPLEGIEVEAVVDRAQTGAKLVSPRCTLAGGALQPERPVPHRRVAVGGEEVARETQVGKAVTQSGLARIQIPRELHERPFEVEQDRPQLGGCLTLERHVLLPARSPHGASIAPRTGRRTGRTRP